jgi:hypothetical protein
MITDVMRRAGFQGPDRANGAARSRSAPFDGRQPDTPMVPGRRQSAGQAALPYLHGPPGYQLTLVYITVTQDLLQEASERFRAVGARCLTMEARP